jgi:hypothetical protein
VNYTPPSTGKSEEWAAIVSSAEENKENYCNALRGKILFSALYDTYTVMLNEIKIPLLLVARQDKPVYQTVSRRCAAVNGTPLRRQPALPRKRL